MNRRVIGVAATVLALVVIIGVAIVLGGRFRNNGSQATPAPQKLITVHGMIGSEKAPYFNDPKVKAAFRRAGYDVQVDTAGSVQQLGADPKKYDFFFPGSAPVAAELANRTGGKSYAPFYSPIVIYSFADIAKLLKSAHVVTVEDGVQRFDIAKYEALVRSSKNRWSDLPGAASVYNTNKTVLATTTDPAKSNSALMFASLAAYVAGGNKVPTKADVAKVAPKIKPLFADQGYKESSSEGPFEDYLALGKGKVPLLVGYESQLLALQIAHDPSVSSDMTVLYPSPGLITKHTLVATSDRGNQIGQLLLDDQTLVSEQATYGFRPANANLFKQTLSKAGVKEPPALADYVDPADYATLDQLTKAIG